MRTALSFLSCLVAVSLLAACGGSAPDIAQSCDDGRQRYLEATEHDKLKVPDDLDEPDKLKELPLPEATPRPDRPADAPCLELPPGVSSRGTGGRQAQQEVEREVEDAEASDE